MDILDHSEDEEERSHSGGRFGARWQKPRSRSHHQLLLMDSVNGNGNGTANGGVEGDGASEDQEILPLPEYERLSQSARLPDDPDPKNPLLPEYRVASPLPPPPPPLPRPQKKPAAWRLIEYVRSRHKAGVPGACGSSDDGESKSSDGEREGDDGGSEDGKSKEEKSKKRSSWLPDRERRWPVQGFY